MYRWHLLFNLGTKDKDKAKVFPWVSFQRYFWGIQSNCGEKWQQGGQEGEHIEGICEGKLKVLEGGIQPHLVLRGECWGSSSNSSGVKMLCLFGTELALDLCWCVLRSRNNTLFCSSSLTSQRKESPWVLLPAHPLAAALCCLSWGSFLPTHFEPSGRCWQVWMMTHLLSGHTFIAECQDILGSTASHHFSLSLAA